MADGDYERGRGRELEGLAAKLRAWRAAVPAVWVLNGWAASPHAWDLCRFPRTRIFSYLDQLDGEPERLLREAPPEARFVLVGWSMGGSGVLRLASRFPKRVAGLVLVAATPRMMESREDGWKGMSPRRLEAFEYGLRITHGAGFFGVPDGKPNPYQTDSDEYLARGLAYLVETDLRADLAAAFPAGRPVPFPVHIFQSEHDGIVRPENAAYLQTVFPQAIRTVVPGTEHALPILIPEALDGAVNSILHRHAH